MNQILRLLSFWFVRVLGRAFDDALQFGRIHLPGTCLTLASTVLAACIYSYFRGPDSGYDKILWYAVNTLCSFAIVVALALSVFFVRAPLLLLDEASDKISEQAEKLMSITSEFATAMQNHGEEKAKLVDAAETARKPDPSTSIKLDRLKKIIADYQIVIAMCDKSQKEAIERFYSADVRGVDFIREEHGDVDGFNGNFPHTNTYQTKVRYDKSDFDRYKAMSSHRIQYLNEFLKHYG